MELEGSFTRHVFRPVAHCLNQAAFSRETVGKVDPRELMAMEDTSPMSGHGLPTIGDTPMLLMRPPQALQATLAEVYRHQAVTPIPGSATWWSMPRMYLLWDGDMYDVNLHEREVLSTEVAAVHATETTGNVASLTPLVIEIPPPVAKALCRLSALDCDIDTSLAIIWATPTEVWQQVRHLTWTMSLQRRLRRETRNSLVMTPPSTNDAATVTDHRTLVLSAHGHPLCTLTFQVAWSETAQGWWATLRCMEPQTLLVFPGCAVTVRYMGPCGSLSWTLMAHRNETKLETVFHDARGMCATSVSLHLGFAAVMPVETLQLQVQTSLATVLLSDARPWELRVTDLLRPFPSFVEPGKETGASPNDGVEDILCDFKGDCAEDFGYVVETAATDYREGFIAGFAVANLASHNAEVKMAEQTVDHVEEAIDDDGGMGTYGTGCNTPTMTERRSSHEEDGSNGPNATPPCSPPPYAPPLAGPSIPSANYYQDLLLLPALDVACHSSTRSSQALGSNGRHLDYRYTLTGHTLVIDALTVVAETLRIQTLIVHATGSPTGKLVKVWHVHEPLTMTLTPGMEQLDLVLLDVTGLHKMHANGYPPSSVPSALVTDSVSLQELCMEEHGERTLQMQAQVFEGKLCDKSRWLADMRTLDCHVAVDVCLCRFHRATDHRGQPRGFLSVTLKEATDHIHGSKCFLALTLVRRQGLDVFCAHWLRRRFAGHPDTWIPTHGFSVGDPFEPQEEENRLDKQVHPPAQALLEVLDRQAVTHMQGFPQPSSMIMDGPYGVRVMLGLVRV